MNFENEFNFVKGRIQRLLKLTYKTNRQSNDEFSYTFQLLHVLKVLYQGFHGNCRITGVGVHTAQRLLLVEVSSPILSYV